MTSTVLSAAGGLATPEVLICADPSLAPVGSARPRPVNNLALCARLLDALPPAARVLCVGDEGEWLANAYRQRHQGTAWHRVDWDEAALRTAAASADVVVVPDGLDAVREPHRLLRLLSGCLPARTPIFFGFRNDACLDNLVRLVEGDLSVPVEELSQQSHPNSPASVWKLLMDAGWMPQLVGHTRADDSVLAEAATPLASTLDVPRATAHRVLGMEGFVVEARCLFAPLVEPAGAAPKSRFAVVVPTTRTRQLQLNVQSSPGLRETATPVVAVRHASSPAEALEQALPHIDQDWILLCHQDVYFPAGFGRRLNDLLGEVPPEKMAGTLLGFVGMGVDAQHKGFAPAGFVIDRLDRVDHPESTTAISIDELAIVISRHSMHRIDASMGWHLWATDLCLTAICKHEIFPRIARLPLFHNSLNDHTLPAAFHDSARHLAQKFPAFGPIPTLCATIDRSFLAQRDQTPPKKVEALARPASAASQPTCCICNQAVGQWKPHPNIDARSEFMKLLDAVGSDLSVYQCPSCLSTDRDRHLWHYMRAVGLFDRIASMRVLHIAPERHLEALILRLEPLSYIRGDLHPHESTHEELNVESLDFDMASFDLIICNHVLEHVADPVRALAELHRCLTPDGVLIAQTPYAPALKNTLELTRPVSGAFAKLFYGQEDHLRLFGADIVSIFHAAGFSGELLPHSVVLADLDAKAHGCNAREPFFCFSK